MTTTLAERILARASSAASVQPGEIVTVEVDLAMMHDSGGPRRVAGMLQRIGAEIWNPDKVVLVSDHYVPAIDAESAAILDLTRKFAREKGIRNFFDMRGICHVVLPENGLIHPGMMAVGGDSHSTTGGAYGAFMVGIGSTEMASVLATGKIWIRVPHTVRFNWRGRVAAGVSAKDMILHLCATIPADDMNYCVAEFAGEAVSALPMQERMTLSNMVAELGAKTGMIHPDATTAGALIDAGLEREEAERHVAEWSGSEAAPCLRQLDLDAATLAPQVAAPDHPSRSVGIDTVGSVAIDQAYIGACTGAKIEDLRMAASVLKGRKVASGVRLLVAPASTRTTATAVRDGTLEILTEAGAILLPSGCGACAGLGAGLLAAGETCIATTARNFKGRMGDASASVWLGSPYTVAASAVAGRIIDPRQMLS